NGGCIPETNQSWSGSVCRRAGCCPFYFCRTSAGNHCRPASSATPPHKNPAEKRDRIANDKTAHCLRARCARNRQRIQLNWQPTMNLSRACWFEPQSFVSTTEFFKSLESSLRCVRRNHASISRDSLLRRNNERRARVGLSDADRRRLRDSRFQIRVRRTVARTENSLSTIQQDRQRRF